MTITAVTGADAAASAPVSPAGPVPHAPARRSASWAWLGLTPFAAYLLLFLAVPTVLAIGSGFFTRDGAFTWTNVAALADPVVLRTFGNSAMVSLLTAAVGAVTGALVCYAMLGLNPDGTVRRSVDAAAGVLAQFGGVMLAFAFIATIGVQGVITALLRDSFGIDIFVNGTWLYELPGLILPYIYFQVPLMVITFMPALAALRPQVHSPGMEGIGIAAAMRAGDPAAVEARLGENYGETVGVWPATARPIGFPVVLVEPYTPRRHLALGFDMYSEPVRREAMRRAWQTGRPAASGIVRIED